MLIKWFTGACKAAERCLALGCVEIGTEWLDNLPKAIQGTVRAEKKQSPVLQTHTSLCVSNSYTVSINNNSGKSKLLQRSKLDWGLPALGTGAGSERYQPEGSKPRQFLTQEAQEKGWGHRGQARSLGRGEF